MGPCVLRLKDSPVRRAFPVSFWEANPAMPSASGWAAHKCSAYRVLPPAMVIVKDSEWYSLRPKPWVCQSSVLGTLAYQRLFGMAKLDYSRPSGITKRWRSTFFSILRTRHFGVYA